MSTRGGPPSTGSSSPQEVDSPRRVRPGRLDDGGCVQSGQASPAQRGVPGRAVRRRARIRRTFILHANGSKLPSDLLGLTSVRYDPATSPAELHAINQKLRKAIETEGRRGPVEGLWWQLSLTVRSEAEPSAVSLLRISRDRDGGLNVSGRAWQEDGTLRPATGARLRRSAGSGRHPLLEGEWPRTRMPRSSRAPPRSVGERRPRHRILDGTFYSDPGLNARTVRHLPSSLTPQTSSCWRTEARRSAPSSSGSV